jgi:hypothetical protein
MRDARQFFGARFRRSDVKVAENLDRVVINNFPGEGFREEKSKIGFAAGCWTDDSDNWVRQTLSDDLTVAALYP